MTIDPRLFPPNPPPDADERSDWWNWEPQPGPVHLLRGLQESADTGNDGCRLILDVGTDFVPTHRPGDVPEGKPMCCFANAYDLALRRGYRYVEGFGAAPREPAAPARHAWCLDAEGRVVDPTWSYDDTASLRGIILPLDFVAPFVAEHTYGTIDGEMYKRLGEVAAAAGLTWNNPRER